MVSRFAFLVELFDRRFRLILGLAERILGVLQSIERLGDYFFDRLASLRYGVRLRIAAGLTECRGEKTQKKSISLHGKILHSPMTRCNSVLPISPARWMTIASFAISTTVEPVFDGSSPPSIKISILPAK